MSEKIAVGVDLGGTNGRAARIDLETMTVLEEAKEPVPAEGRAPEAVADLVARLVQKVDPEGKRAGAGVGFAGMLRGWSGVVQNAPNFGWREVDFRALLRARIDPRVELYNDLNAIAFGEATAGAARGARDVLCVFVGTGIGGGLVVNGELAIGASHLAGEIGHTKVVPNGRLCGCGQRGCVEAYASGRNLANRAREDLSSGERSLAVQLAGAVDQVHAGHLDEAARAGDLYAVALWNEVAPLLGTVLANAVTLLNPARLVLGGGAWEGSPGLRKLVLAAYQGAVNAPSGEACQLVDSTLGDAAGVIGAAALIGSGVIK
jgi:glucokinase